MNLFDVLFAKKLFQNGEYPPIIKRITGNPISFSDAADAPMVECKVAFTPKQDLHGQDKPWVGGAGRNVISDGTDTNNGYVNNKYIQYDGTLGNSTEYFVTEYFPISQNQYIWSCSYNPNSPCIAFYDSSKTFISTVQAGKALPKIITPPPNAAYCRASQYQGVNATKYMQLELGSTATTYAPYSNICPITGMDEVEIRVSGKNIGEISTDSLSSSYHSSVTYQDAGCVVTATGNYSRVRYAFKVVPGYRFTVSFKAYASADSYAKIYYNNEANWSDAYGNITVSQTERTYTKTFLATKKYFYFTIYNTTSGTSGIMTVKDFQLEYGSASTTYEPYITPTQYTINLNGTRYGGTVDAVRGNFNQTWGYIASYAGETLPGPWLSDRDEYAPGTTPTTGAEVAYELSSPVDVPIAPTVIRTLSGNNYISTDADNLDITYITEGYQDFVNTVESALPNTRKGGTTAMDIFRSLEVEKDKPEEVKEEEKEETNGVVKK